MLFASNHWNGLTSSNFDNVSFALNMRSFHKGIAYISRGVAGILPISLAMISKYLLMLAGAPSSKAEKARAKSGLSGW